MIATIAKALHTVPEIRRKIAFTALMLALYRCMRPPHGSGHQRERRRAALFGSPRPGSSLERWSLLNLFLGRGALTQMAVFALGIMPWIAASIVC